MGTEEVMMRNDTARMRSMADKVKSSTLFRWVPGMGVIDSSGALYVVNYKRELALLSTGPTPQYPPKTEWRINLEWPGTIGALLQLVRGPVYMQHLPVDDNYKYALMEAIVCIFVSESAAYDASHGGDIDDALLAEAGRNAPTHAECYECSSVVQLHANLSYADVKSLGCDKCGEAHLEGLFVRGARTATEEGSDYYHFGRKRLEVPEAT